MSTELCLRAFAGKLAMFFHLRIKCGAINGLSALCGKFFGKLDGKTKRREKRECLCAGDITRLARNFFELFDAAVIGLLERRLLFPKNSFDIGALLGKFGVGAA